MGYKLHPLFQALKIKLNRLSFALFISQLVSLCIQAQQTGTGRELFDAIRSGSSELVQKKVVGGANVNDTLDGYSALMAATLNGTPEQMKILIVHGADVNFADRDGVTALWLAIPDHDKVTLLLSHGADVQHTVHGYGILVKLALLPGTVKLMNQLIDHGADPKKSAPDNSLLYNAATSGDTSLLGLLLRKGLGVNDTISNGDYPINAALIFRTFATLKMLVDNGANVNVRPVSFRLEAFNGFTPLMFTSVGNDKRSFYYLLDHGADPNIKNDKGYTALMLLQQSENDDPAMTQALIDHGAKTSVQTPAGNDALYFAMKKGNTRSAELLKKYKNN